MTDAYIVIAWIYAYGAGFGIDTDRLVAAGDSAGGTLAAVTSMVLRAKAKPANPIALQVLVYPIPDLVSDRDELAAESWARGATSSPADDRGARRATTSPA